MEVFSLVDFRASRISLSRLVAAAASSVFRCKTCIAPRWLRSQFRAKPERDDKTPLKKLSPLVCDRFSATTYSDEGSNKENIAPTVSSSLPLSVVGEVLGASASRTHFGGPPYEAVIAWKVNRVRC